MKKIILIFFILIVCGSCKKAGVQPSLDCTTGNFSAHPKAGTFNAILEKYIQKGLPGIALLVKDSSGTWTGSLGKADIDKNIDMQTCHISKVASITKIFMATLTFKLAEEGVLNLDEKVSTYLSSEVIGKIKNADQVTIRQLLSHNSGIYDVITDNGFYLGVLNNPNKNWEQEELLKYVYNKPAAYAPGAGPGYSNTNTLLISMIIDKVTGKPHGQLLREKILNPLNLTNTFYYYREALPEGKVAQGYYDLYNNGTIANLSNYNTGSGNGYTGLYSNVFDLYTFIDALLVQQTLLQPASLSQMLTFNPIEESEKLLGAGIFKDFIHHPSGHYAYGHRGRDLAYSADLFYFPVKNQVFALVVNYGTDAESKLRPAFYDLRNEIVTAMMQ
ncbi:MAG: beta-lactamase family protein [Cytophagaceae bacterium]|nr:beta-lactamase family protein [Cytophagaceae bacterium]